MHLRLGLGLLRVRLVQGLLEPRGVRLERPDGGPGEARSSGF